MLLALQIGLTIAAWRRGWKAWALLPLGIAFGAALVIGLVMGISGASEGGIFAMGLFFDIACISGLIAMVVKPRGEKHLVTSKQSQETASVQIQ
jgi:hypothetical protein